MPNAARSASDSAGIRRPSGRPRILAIASAKSARHTRRHPASVVGVSILSANGASAPSSFAQVSRSMSAMSACDRESGVGAGTEAEAEAEAKAEAEGEAEAIAEAEVSTIAEAVAVGGAEAIAEAVAVGGAEAGAVGGAVTEAASSGGGGGRDSATTACVSVPGSSASLVTLVRPCSCRFFFLKSVFRLLPFLAFFAS